MALSIWDASRRLLLHILGNLPCDAGISTHLPSISPPLRVHIFVRSIGPWLGHSCWLSEGGGKVVETPTNGNANSNANGNSNNNRNTYLLALTTLE